MLQMSTIVAILLALIGLCACAGPSSSTSRYHRAYDPDEVFEQARNHRISQGTATRTDLEHAHYGAFPIERDEEGRPLSAYGLQAVGSDNGCRVLYAPVMYKGIAVGPLVTSYRTQVRQGRDRLVLSDFYVFRCKLLFSAVPDELYNSRRADIDKLADVIDQHDEEFAQMHDGTHVWEASCPDWEQPQRDHFQDKINCSVIPGMAKLAEEGNKMEVPQERPARREVIGDDGRPRLVICREWVLPRSSPN